MSGIPSKFHPPKSKNLGSLLVEAANGRAFEKHLETVTTFYNEDLNRSLLSAQLQNFSTHFAVQTKERAGEVLLAVCLEHFRGVSSSQKEFYSEVGQLVRLILVMPATSERTFSMMGRLKTYLRNTMSQARLNHVMILNIYKQETDNINIDAIANEFVCGNEYRLSKFGKFH